MQPNIFPTDSQTSTILTTEKLEKKGEVLWFTGLSGAGKSTIAIHLEQKLSDEGIICRILDGDNLRVGLNRDLSFTEADRIENIRRTAEVAKLFSEIGIIVVVALISPTQAMRDLARTTVGEAQFIEVYINASLDVCEKRDTKGLYAKARQGEVENFTGISAAFEAPNRPHFILNTEGCNIQDCVSILYTHIKQTSLN